MMLSWNKTEVDINQRQYQGEVDVTLNLEL